MTTVIGAEGGPTGSPEKEEEEARTGITGPRVARGGTPVVENEASDDDYSSDSTDDDPSGDEGNEGEDMFTLSPGLDYTWTNETIRQEQELDDAIGRVKAWVEMGERPPSGAMEPEPGSASIGAEVV